MIKLRVIYEIITVESKGYEAIDLTSHVEEFITRNSLRDGIIYLSSRETGVVITLIEYEPNLLSDLEKLFTKNKEYTYILESIIGKTASIPIVNGEIYTGVFKHPVLIDLTNKPGIREVLLIYEGL